MGYSQVIDNLDHINGGYGELGENFGAVLLQSVNSIVLGLSGDKVIGHLKQKVQNEGIKNFNLILPFVTYHELVNLDNFNKTFPNSTILVSEGLQNLIENPTENLFTDHFLRIDKNNPKKAEKKLPNKIKNVEYIDKSWKWEMEDNKLLPVFMEGPQRGNCFIFSVSHKAIFTGIFNGISPADRNLYYLDLTGSIPKYDEGFKFLAQANVDLNFPAYDQAEFPRDNYISTAYIKSSISEDKELIKKILSSKFMRFNEIVDAYVLERGEVNVFPYNSLSFTETKVMKLLTELDIQNMIESNGDQFRLK